MLQRLQPLQSLASRRLLAEIIYNSEIIIILRLIINLRRQRLAGAVNGAAASRQHSLASRRRTLDL